MSISLPYVIANGVDADGDELGANLDALATGAVAISGSTMTGALILNGAAPATDNTAASKSYVDAAHPKTALFERTSNTVVSGTTTTISFQTETTDTDGWFDVGVSAINFTCPASGVYAFALEVRCTSAVAAAVTGSIVHMTSLANLGTTTTTLNIPVTDRYGTGGEVGYMNLGDVLNVTVGTSGVVTVDNVKLTITKLAVI